MSKRITFMTTEGDSPNKEKSKGTFFFFYDDLFNDVTEVICLILALYKCCY